MKDAAGQGSLCDPAPSTVELLTGMTTARADAEAFIRACFARAYGAEVRQFLPALMSLRDKQGRLAGALGLRDAARERLFLEHYFDLPVEQVLARACNAPIDRARLVEVGNLAVAVPGGGRWLITALTAYLHAAGAHWVVFTCGPALRNAFGRLGIDLLDLGPAEVESLPAGEAAAWGRYYEQRPRVMAGRVTEGHAVLASLARNEGTLGALFRSAVQAGSLAA